MVVLDQKLLQVGCITDIFVVTSSFKFIPLQASANSLKNNTFGNVKKANKISMTARGPEKAGGKASGGRSRVDNGTNQEASAL